MRTVISVTFGLLLALSCVWAYSEMGPALADASRPLTIGLASVAGLGFWAAGQPRSERTKKASYEPHFEIG